MMEVAALTRLRGKIVSVPLYKNGSLRNYALVECAAGDVYFMHRTYLCGDGRYLKVGQVVEFTPAPGKPRPHATFVFVIDKAA